MHLCVSASAGGRRCRCRLVVQQTDHPAFWAAPAISGVYAGTARAVQRTAFSLGRPFLCRGGQQDTEGNAKNGEITVAAATRGRQPRAFFPFFLCSLFLSFRSFFLSFCFLFFFSLLQQHSKYISLEAADRPPDRNSVNASCHMWFCRVRLSLGGFLSFPFRFLGIYP